MTAADRERQKFLFKLAFRTALEARGYSDLEKLALARSYLRSFQALEASPLADPRLHRLLRKEANYSYLKQAQVGAATAAAVAARGSPRLLSWILRVPGALKSTAGFAWKYLVGLPLIVTGLAGLPAGFVLGRYLASLSDAPPDIEKDLQADELAALYEAQRKRLNMETPVW